MKRWVKVLGGLALLTAGVAAAGGGVALRSQDGSRREAQEKTARLVYELCVGLEEFQRRFCDYPPSSWAEFAAFTGTNTLQPPENATNTGAECLWLAQRFTPLVTPRPGSRNLPNGVWPERSGGNLDRDRVGFPGASPPKGIATEWVDFWGNPLVYIHFRDYAKSFKLKLNDGSVVTAKAQLDPETGRHFQLESYQLFSLGPDGKPGTADDITNWLR